MHLLGNVGIKYSERAISGGGVETSSLAPPFLRFMENNWNMTST